MLEMPNYILCLLNEVLSLNAQEYLVLDVVGLASKILNEVLSLNAQELGGNLTV